MDSRRVPVRGRGVGRGRERGARQERGRGRGASKASSPRGGRFAACSTLAPRGGVAKQAPHEAGAVRRPARVANSVEAILAGPSSPGPVSGVVGGAPSAGCESYAGGEGPVCAPAAAASLPVKIEAAGEQVVVESLSVGAVCALLDECSFDSAGARAAGTDGGALVEMLSCGPGLRALQLPVAEGGLGITAGQIFRVRSALRARGVILPPLP